MLNKVVNQFVLARCLRKQLETLHLAHNLSIGRLVSQQLKAPSTITTWTQSRQIANFTTPIPLTHNKQPIKTMLEWPWGMSFQLRLMLLKSQRVFITRLLWLSWLGHLYSLVFFQLMNQIIFFITLGRRAHSHPCSVESMLCVGTQQVKSVALRVNCVRLHALHSLSESNQNQDQMALAAQQSMTLIWQNVFSVASAKKHAQSMQLLKDLTLSMRHSFTKNCYMIKRNWLRMAINGNHNSQESWKSSSELDDKKLKNFENEFRLLVLSAFIWLDLLYLKF